VVPDILIEGSGSGRKARVAVDAKYKLYDERRLSSGDVYQSFLYAYAYGGAGGPVLPAALLVYPSSTGSGRSVWLRVRGAQTLAAAEILALGLSIPDTLAEVAGQLRGPATTALIEAVQQGLGSAGHVAA
jgi:5-methylcytosine-specific restriction enzyme subunit McrC